MPNETVAPGAKPEKVAVTPFLRYDDSDCVAGVTDEDGWATTVIVVLAEAGSARRRTAEGSTSPVTVIVCSPGSWSRAGG